MTEQFMADLTDEERQAVESWFPPWKRPVLMSHWEKLEQQAYIFAASSTETLEKTRQSGMPEWFIQRGAKNQYRLNRRFRRIRNRVAALKAELGEKILHAIFSEES